MKKLTLEGKSSYECPMLIRKEDLTAFQVRNRSTDSLKASRMLYDFTTIPQKKPQVQTLAFGEFFTDHMLIADWHNKLGWNQPLIRPTAPIHLHPASSCLHYGLQVFEGLKVYRDLNGIVRFFRVKDHIKRFNRSCERMCLPVIKEDDLLELIVEYVRIEKSWVPEEPDTSLYLRPLMISTDSTIGIKPPSEARFIIMACPVGSYFKSGLFTGVSLFADNSYVRAWPGGVGNFKTGGNYAPTILLQRYAMEKHNCSQILWLFDDKVTECGSMNIFVYWVNKDGKRELITPELNDLILPGVTRSTILSITNNWPEIIVKEGVITMTDILKASNEGRLLEMFGSGTACVVCPIKSIKYQGIVISIAENEEYPFTQRIKNKVKDYHLGAILNEWNDVIIHDH